MVPGFGASPGASAGRRAAPEVAVKTYFYVVRDDVGSRLEGTLEAPDENTARDRLRERGYRVLEIETRSSWLSRRLPFVGRTDVGPRRRAGFARRLSILLDAGVPLLRALRVLEEQTDHPGFERILRRVSRDVEAGLSFSEALSMHTGTFDELFVNTVRAGEAGGVLGTVLERLAEIADKNRELRDSVRSAMLYPALVGCLAGGVVIFLLTAVLPTFAALYRDMNVQLPLATRFMVDGGRFLRTWWYLLVPALPAAWYGFRGYYATDVGERRVDGLLLRMPLFGELIVKEAVARFARTLGTLLESGVSLLEAIDLVRGTLGNRILVNLMEEVALSVREGGTISDPIRESSVFDPMLPHMIAVGERTGRLPEMLHRVADIYRARVDARVEELSSLLEPALIVAVGLAVGVIVLGMYLPLFQLMEVIG